VASFKICEGLNFPTKMISECFSQEVSLKILSLLLEKQVYVECTDEVFDFFLKRDQWLSSECLMDEVVALALKLIDHEDCNFSFPAILNCTMRRFEPF
jgi:hypothetical protein